MKKGLLVFLMSVFILFEDYVYGKRVVTGRELEVKGNIVISRGDSKVVSDSDVMTADTMVYDKKKQFKYCLFQYIKNGAFLFSYKS